MEQADAGTNDTSLSSLRRPRPGVFWWVTVLVVFVLGAIATGDPQIAAEHRGDTAISRAFTRASSIASGDDATAMRLDLWSATGKMIAAHPLAGIGAGAWEHEADYYAHNEFLQLMAEYGAVGWLFLAALGTWLVRAARGAGDWQWALLASMSALAIVAGAGYPMHLAVTATLFALCTGSLAAPRARTVHVTRTAASALTIACAIALGLATYATWRASYAESRLARAARIALDVGGTSNPNDPRWTPARSEMLRLVDEGMRLHPGELQLTPIVADALASWGDWPNAIRIWEHVLRAHPDRVVVLANVARGYIAIGRPEIAAAYLARARSVQADAPSVRAVETLLRQMSSSKG